MADNDPIIIGQGNTGSNETSLSRNESTDGTVFVAQNQNVGDGIHGEASGGSAGVVGSSDTGVGVDGVSSSGFAVRGTSSSSTGVVGSSNTFIGVQGFTLGSGTGVEGQSNTGTGVVAGSNSGRGVVGSSSTGTGVDGIAFGSGSGVSGHSQSGFGVSGFSFSSTGVDGFSAHGHGVVGSTTDRANRDGGFFDGGITVVNGNKNFKIDHPLDPQNRYLLHTCVESSERKNVYDGVARLDEDGSVWVALPEWFEALNGDFRYQLTAVGQAAPNLHVAEEVSENRFKIAGGQEGMKVCWQVTGSRKDRWAAANPFEVEQEKPEEERGRYLEPNLYDAPEEQRVPIRLIVEAGEEEQRPPEPSDIDFARLEEEHRRRLDELRRLEEEQRREMEELRRRMEEERQEEAPPEST